MPELLYNVLERLTPLAKSGDIPSCEREAISAMQLLPVSPFHIAIDLDITNTPDSAAEHFDRFFLHERQRRPVEAVYTEMNGFYINPDRWYCDVFAYAAYGGHEDQEWLCNWQSERYVEYDIVGLEKLQRVYDSDAYFNEEYPDAADLSTLLVVIKFQSFIRAAAKQMRHLNLPLLVSAHDFPLLAEFKPATSDDA